MQVLHLKHVFIDVNVMKEKVKALYIVDTNRMIFYYILNIQDVKGYLVCRYTERNNVWKLMMMISTIWDF